MITTEFTQKIHLEICFCYVESKNTKLTFLQTWNERTSWGSICGGSGWQTQYHQPPGHIGLLISQFLSLENEHNQRKKQTNKFGKKLKQIQKTELKKKWNKKSEQIWQ